MDHYLDIRLLPDPEFPSAQLMNVLFAKLHRSFAQQQRTDVGISFPDAGNGRGGLGMSLRLHGTLQALQQQMAQNWLSGMRDHAQIGDATPVPPAHEHQVVRRVQAKSNPERLRRRQMKRKGWTAEQAREAIPDSAAEFLKLPFLTVRSLSTGQNFRLFVHQYPAVEARSGIFNSYGLSGSATVPRF